MTSFRHTRAFTLIELMIAIVVVAILLAIAYPSYMEQIRKANRTEAMEALSRAAIAQERFLFSYGRYATSLGGAATADPATSGLGLPTSTREDPADNAFYELTMEAAGPLQFTLSAAPAGSTQASDRCGTLVLTHAGQRGAALESCW